MEESPKEKEPSKVTVPNDTIEEDSFADSEEDENPEVTMVDDDGRADIVEYTPTEIPKFIVGAKVKIITASGGRGGPYVIETVIPSTRQYTLASEGGDPVNHGRKYEEDDLERA